MEKIIMGIESSLCDLNTCRLNLAVFFLVVFAYVWV